MAGTPVGITERNGSGTWAAVFRHRWKVLAVALVLAVAGYFAAGALLTPSYTATATITLSKDRPFDATATGNNAAQLGDATQWAALQAAVVDTSEVLTLATTPLTTSTGTVVSVPVSEQEDFRQGLTIEPSTDTNQITVTSTAPTAAAAAQIADAVAYAYQTYSLTSVTGARDAALASVAATDTRFTGTITAA